MKYLNHVIHIILLVGVVALGYLYITKKPDTNIVQEFKTESAPVTVQEGLSVGEIQDLIDSAVATLSAQPKETTTIVEKVIQAPAAKDTQTTYVPVGSTHASSSRDWTTIEGTGVYIDVANDYGENAYIEFEANIKMQHGNGTAFVRLYDDTNKIAVANSELSSLNNLEYELKISPRIYLWQGRNLYKLQLKSGVGFETTVNNAKIKISY